MNIRTTKPATTGRKATIRKVAIPATVAAGTLAGAIATTSGLPAVLGALAYKHNESLLTPTAEPEPSKRSRRPGRRASAAAVGVTAGALVILAETGPAFAGLNLGNHNESLVTPPDGPPPAQRTRPRRGRLAVSALALAAGLAVTAGFVNDGTSNTRHEAIPGNYTSSSGGGGRTYR
jgi:hypothetical protein